MKNIFLLLFFLLVLVLNNQGQTQINRKGRIFAYWGYNRSAYTKSDVHIKGEGYELEFNDVKAADKPTPFSSTEYLQPSNISKPQYNYRIGYFLSDRLSLSIGMDHMKYFMVENQNLSVTGYVTDSESPYHGVYNGETTPVNWHFLWFHHSDGLNYTSLELEYNFPVWISASKKFYADAVGNVGLGLVVPKTYVRIMQQEQDNRFHVAGGGPSAKLGARFTFFTNFFLESSLKAGYVWMPDILVNDENTATMNQRFGWLQWYTAMGFSIPLTK